MKCTSYCGARAESAKRQLATPVSRRPMLCRRTNPLSNSTPGANLDAHAFAPPVVQAMSWCEHECVLKPTRWRARVQPPRPNSTSCPGPQDQWGLDWGQPASMGNNDDEFGAHEATTSQDPWQQCRLPPGAPNNKGKTHDGDKQFARGMRRDVSSNMSWSYGAWTRPDMNPCVTRNCGALDEARRVKEIRNVAATQAPT